MTAYYFDGHTAITDPGVVWTNDANAFDGNTGTVAACSTVGSTSSNYLYGQGTNTPLTGNPIQGVQLRIYRNPQNAGGILITKYVVYTAALAETLGTMGLANTLTGYTPYIVLTAPAAGWSWTTLANLEIKCYLDTGTTSAVTEQIGRIELEVNIASTPGNISRHITVGNGMSRNELAT